MSDIEKNDVEQELGNEETPITVPFDPADINIKIVPRHIGQLVELLEDNQILIPKYQRLPNLWSETKKSRFIESLMLDLPIPLFYFDEHEDKKWYVVDGLQRMSTLEHFMLGKGTIGNNKNQLRLSNLEFLIQFNGCIWDDLPNDVKRRINSNQVSITLISKGTPDEVKYTIFSRINQGDVPLKAQEIRTALFQGYRVDFLESLISKDTETGQCFQKATDGSVKFERQQDLDFVSRFIAFYILDYQQYEPDMDRFITLGTKKIPEDLVKQNNIRQAFQKALQLAFDVFGDDAFRKRTNKESPRSPINKPIFEVLSLAFSRLTDKQECVIRNRKSDFIDGFMVLQQDKKFLNAITTGTATKESVMNRNTVFKSFLTEFLNDQ